MPAVYVKPYVKRGKNDAADAEAICEAVTRQTMRFVPIKSREQQAALSLHRVRSLLIKQRTQLVNMMRSVLADRSGECRRSAGRATAPASCPVAQARPASRRLTADRRQGPTPSDDPWYRTDRRDRARRVGDRSRPVLVRAPVRCLAGADPTAELQWRQGTFRAHYQDGRQISAVAPGRRRNRADPIRQGETRHGRSAFRRSARQKARARRLGRHCQQNGADRMGGHGARRRVRTRACAYAGGSIDQELS